MFKNLGPTEFYSEAQRKIVEAKRTSNVSKNKFTIQAMKNWTLKRAEYSVAALDKDSALGVLTTSFAAINVES